MTDAHVLREAGGTISIAPSALTQVVQHAAETVEGARLRRRKRGLELRVVDGRAKVEVELAVRFGLVLPELARAVQDRVADALTGMCGLEVEAVDVSIEELDGA